MISLACRRTAAAGFIGIALERGYSPTSLTPNLNANALQERILSLDPKVLMSAGYVFRLFGYYLLRSNIIGLIRRAGVVISRWRKPRERGPGSWLC